MRAYSEYKDSGVEWLGEIPVHWSTLSLKRTIESCVNGIWGNEPDGKNDITVLRVADFDRVALCVSEKKLTIRAITKKERLPRLLKKGDLLLEKSGGGEKTLVGCVVHFSNDFPAVTSNFVAKMTPCFGYDSQFITYAFSHLYEGKVNFPSIKQTTGIQNIDADSYLINYFSFPNIEEQKIISIYLNRKTARIDKLIREKQNFIKLLKEKRQALISHVVTKGLDHHVKMKDSGIEWIGEVPEHWVVKKIKYTVVSIGQGWSPQCESTPVSGEDEWGVLKVGCVNRGVFNPNQNKKLPDDLTPIPELGIKSGDLLVSRANAREWVGSAAVAQHDYPNLLLCDKLYRIKLDINFTSPDYLSYYLGSDSVREQIEVAATGTSSSMLNIGQKTILDLSIAQPSLAEQENILKHLEISTSNIELITKEVNKSIKLLKEHRTALISAAVTGKIDVRDHAQ